MMPGSRSVLVLLIATLAFFLLLVGNTSGATIIVDDDGGSWSNFDGIQDAINASSEGDTIHIYNGTYKGRILVNRTITIVGNGSQSIRYDKSGVYVHNNLRTVLKDGASVGGKDDAIITVVSDNVNISNLGVINGRENGMEIIASNVTIDSCHFSGNKESGIITGSGAKDIAVLNSNTSWNEQRGIEINGARVELTNTNSSNNLFDGVKAQYVEAGFEMSHCIASFNGHNGVDLHGSDNNTILDCNFSGNGQAALVLDFTDSTEVQRTTMIDNPYEGLEMFLSSNMVLGNLTLVDTPFGLFSSNVDAYKAHKIEDITFNSGELKYIAGPHADITEGTYSGLFIVGADGITISNVIVENGPGIYIEKAQGVTINDSTIRSTQVGIEADLMNNSVIQNVKIEQSNSTGIYLRDCHGNYIEESELKENNGSGVALYDSNSNTIKRSKILSSGYEGFTVDGTSSLNTITLNVIEDSGDTDGMVIWAGAGVSFGTDTHNNTVHHNNFIDNAAEKQGDDDGANNAWDDGSEGNHWSDHGGSDLDSDGISEAPYYMSGNADSQDKFPLFEAIDFNPDPGPGNGGNGGNGGGNGGGGGNNNDTDDSSNPLGAILEDPLMLGILIVIIVVIIAAIAGARSKGKKKDKKPSGDRPLPPPPQGGRPDDPRGGGGPHGGDPRQQQDPYGRPPQGPPDQDGYGPQQDRDPYGPPPSQDQRGPPRGGQGPPPRGGVRRAATEVPLSDDLSEERPSSGYRRRRMDAYEPEEEVMEQEEPEYPCVNCGSTLRWIEKYRGWYCDRCGEYNE